MRTGYRQAVEDTGLEDMGGRLHGADQKSRTWIEIIRGSCSKSMYCIPVYVARNDMALGTSASSKGKTGLAKQTQEEPYVRDMIRLKVETDTIEPEAGIWKLSVLWVGWEAR